MSYQVLARKWRPQRFADVLGQQAVTRTLTNALKTGRIAHAFVFAGPRGCGKTTTARLLARALNCVKGPTAEPCGECEPCIEIAEGRDIDVLEIDAATHTGVDNVREVIIEGLSITPVRDRYKVFIIDEVHMLSTSSWNALLKSIEEPPPHVVFIMATTELTKIPDTVRSRAQVYEFRTISSRTVAERLRYIAEQEGIRIDDEALTLLARAGEGSMRDSLSAFDQVRAFAGDAIRAEDVVTVLGLIGRDLVFDMLDAVEREDAAAAFAHVHTALERGYDLRLLCRELARATRDVLVVSVDPSRAADPDVASETERGRLEAFAGRSSREDLLRAFDLLTRAEEEIRLSEQPRFNLEMTLLRLMHLRKLVPLSDLIASGGSALSGGAPSGVNRPRSSAPGTRSASVSPMRSTPAAPATTAPRNPQPAPLRASTPPSSPGGRPSATAAEPAATAAAGSPKEAFLAQVKAAKPFFYNTVVAQAYRIDVRPERITFSFQPNQRVPRGQCEEQRGWLEGLAEQALGRRIPVAVIVVEVPGQPAAPAPAKADDKPAAAPDDLRREAMNDPTVQALLEIFPVEKTRVEEV